MQPKPAHKDWLTLAALCCLKHTHVNSNDGFIVLDLTPQIMVQINLLRSAVFTNMEME